MTHTSANPYRIEERAGTATVRTALYGEVTPARAAEERRICQHRAAQMDTTPPPAPPRRKAKRVDDHLGGSEEY